MPERYLRASQSQRLAVLQGLMDTDGSVIVGGHVEFCTTRQALADGVFELAVSLGHKPVKRAERARIEGRDVGPRWRVTWSPRHQVFRLARKATAVRMTTTQANRTAHRYIVACEQVPSVPVRCIAVDSPSHLFLAGRTMIPTHNTRSAAEWSKTRMLGEPKHRLGIVVPRFADGRDVCVEGESGLLSVLPDDRVKDWNRSLGELKLANGSIARIYAADTEKSAETLRGPQFHSLWYEELANQRYGPVAWDLGMMALRLGSDPRVCVSTTPKPTKLIKELVVDPQVHVTRGSTYDNAANLPAVILERLRAKYEGTTIGRQELHAEVLDDIEGALFTLDLIERARILESGCPEMDRIVVAVDPATTSTAQSDETGVVVVGQHARPALRPGGPLGHLHAIRVGDGRGAGVLRLQRRPDRRGDQPGGRHGRDCGPPGAAARRQDRPQRAVPEGHRHQGQGPAGRARAGPLRAAPRAPRRAPGRAGEPDDHLGAGHQRLTGPARRARLGRLGAGLQAGTDAQLRRHGIGGIKRCLTSR
nr:terminase family protein [Fodinicola feengrottensis]